MLAAAPGDRSGGAAGGCWADIATDSAVAAMQAIEMRVMGPILREPWRRVISFAWMVPRFALSAAFFLSGAAGLVFQIVWLYRCGLVLESSVAVSCMRHCAR